MMLLLSIIIPLISGIVLIFLPFSEESHNSTDNTGKKTISFKTICIYTGVFLLLSLIVLLIAICNGNTEGFDLFNLTKTLTISFGADSVGRFFAVVMSVVWICVGFFSFEYMKHEKNNKRYFGVYLIVLGILMGLCFSKNLVTYYAFYELMTLGSFAMVLHNQSHEAVMAGLKYLFYSFAGAYMVLFGLYFVYKNSGIAALTFTEGGIITGSAGILNVSMLLMIIGFSVKAGMFPMHGWLPTAHPVAPAPASAALSAIIVKSGVLGIIRVIYYIFGVDMFSGSYVQTVVLILSLITVFIGSMLAYKEKVLKKRLAYSTVSQVSYILFGIFMTDATSFNGSMIHVAAHAAIKSTLFLCAGAIIYLTGCTRVDQMRGIGKKMPVMLWCYTIVSLGLIGIPPFGGFASKWYLCIGALDADIPVFSWLGPVILLVSALLTAGYLLPLTINGFLPGKDFESLAEKSSDEDEQYAGYKKAKEPCLMMLIPIIILTVLSVLIGLFPEVLLWA